MSLDLSGAPPSGYFLVGDEKAPIPEIARNGNDLIFRLLRAKAEAQGLIFGGGVLEIVQDGIGFLRSDHFLPGPEDV